MAKKSHTSGERKFGQIIRLLGYGISQNASHGRPRWMIGNIAPIISAKAVITSAQRVTGRRHPAFTRRRIAEISVPAWLMPIQNTKSVMRKPQHTRHGIPGTPTPRHIWKNQANRPEATIVPRKATKTYQST